MTYFEHFNRGDFDAVIQSTLPVVTTDERAREAFLRVFVAKENLFLLSDETIGMLKAAADKKNPYAMYALGRWYSLTLPDENSTDRSLELFGAAYEAGLPEAGAALSLAWTFGDFGEVDKEKAQDFLNEALDNNSILAVWLALRRVIFGFEDMEANPEQALRFIEEYIAYDAKREMPENGLWYFLRGCATEELKGRTAALADYERARDLGVIQAYFWIAFIRGYEDGEELLHDEDYYHALEEGVEHSDRDSIYASAMVLINNYDEQPDDAPVERLERLESQILELLETAASLGQATAIVTMGDMYREGDYGVEPNIKRAYGLYAMAACYEDTDAFERIWDMMDSGEVEASEEEKDYFALRGTRLDSEKLKAETLKAYRAGRLEDYKEEIEKYYLPTSQTTDTTQTPLEATGEALDSYHRTCVEYCEKAKRILQEQDDPSPITDMARELLRLARHMGQFEHMLSKTYDVTRRMAENLFDHPRLLLELKEVELAALNDIEAQQQHHLNITDDLSEEIDQLRANIQAADEGRWVDLHSGRMLKNDPVEWTKAYEDVIDAANREAYSHLSDCPRGMGFCFAYWAELRNALERYGIEWRSPHAMNPGVMFD